MPANRSTTVFIIPFAQILLQDTVIYLHKLLKKKPSFWQCEPSNLLHADEFAYSIIVILCVFVIVRLHCCFLCYL
jgi:hypothetical protein